jgi:hypothetical protein
VLYRKTPPSPPRLLLRIVGTAGALASIVACGSSLGPEGSAGLPGSVTQADVGSGTGDDGFAPVGSCGGANEPECLGVLPSCGPGTNEPECPCVADVSPDGCDAGTSDIPDALPLAPDGSANPNDGSTDGTVFNGIVANPDASDATVFNGIVAHPGDGG